jgi:hypothetical protein
MDTKLSRHVGGPMGTHLPVTEFEAVFIYEAMIDEIRRRVFVSVKTRYIEIEGSFDIGLMQMTLSEWYLLKAMLKDGALLFQNGEATIKIVEHTL